MKVKGGIAHADYLRGFVVDDCLALAVPECGDEVAAGVVGVSFVVERGVRGEAVARIVGQRAKGAVVDLFEMISG